MTRNYCCYLRVSTQKQGRSMLGIDAQRKMCNDFVAHNDGVLAQEFMDIESGTHRDRKGLLDAIAYCKKNHCPLVIAKLDRLARDVEFCFKVINTGIEIHFTDMPQINTLLLGVFAAVAQYERELTSDRTKKALAVKKAQGCKLGSNSPRYIEAMARKSQQEKDEIQMKKGTLKTKRHLESRDSTAFLKAIHRVFPEYTEAESYLDWCWAGIRFRCGYTERMVEVMKDFRDMDSEGKVFARWDFGSPQLHKRLRAYLQAFKKSVEKQRMSN